MPIDTAKISDIVEVPLEPLDNVAYGIIISENKHMDFNQEKAKEIVNYLRELKVNTSAVSRSLASDRDKTNQAQFVLRGTSDNDYRGNVYFNFSKDFSKIWVNNEVKPSFSYSVKNPSEVKAFFERQFGSVASIKEFASSDELWKARTKYIGDNSAVSKLIGLLPVPEDVSYEHFQLHTSEQPYDIEIVYSTSTEVINQYDTENAVKSNPFRKNTLILLALIDNAKGVRVTLTDGKREVEFINGREWVDYVVGEEVRNYAESPEKLEELIDFSFTSMNSAEEAEDFSTYPQDYSSEQGVKDGFFVVVDGEVKGESQSLLDGFLK